jgi:D-glycero-D-manno-heptose 1,7-bisphosphate phosphatase
MGRYSTDINTAAPQPTNQNTAVMPPSNPFGQNKPGMQPQPGQQQMMGPPPGWPTVFPKPIVGLDLNGVIIEDRILNNPGNVVPLPGALEGIRTLRLKGYKLGILSDQPGISNGQMTTQSMDSSIQQLMQIFGNGGIFSIDGVLYNTSSLPQDEYAKPNTGMMNRMQNESGGQVNFKKGWYVGDSIDDLKMADRAGAKPVLVLTGNGNSTLKELDRHSNKDLKKKTLVFNNLLDFANSL